MALKRFHKGTAVWLPCKARGGPFPNERRIYVEIGDSEWFGFVDVSELKDKGRQESDHVRAIVIATEPGRVVLGIRGQSPASRPIQTTPEIASGFSPIAA
jgi:hypothetical protein